MHMVSEHEGAQGGVKNRSDEQVRGDMSTLFGTVPLHGVGVDVGIGIDVAVGVDSGVGADIVS